jgi:carotene epsilon-monooxygenase
MPGVDVVAGKEYINDSDPSVLRFLIAAREEVESTQLRDDLLSMLVAGERRGPGEGPS